MSEPRQPAGTDAGGLPSAVNAQPEAGMPAAPGGPGRRGAGGGLGTAVACGIAVAVLGTGLHGQQLYLGGTGYPWGAAAALVFAWALLLWAGLKVHSVPMAGVAGLVAYVLVGLMASGMGQEPLIITATSLEPELTVALAGKIWVLGLALATVLAVAACAWALRPGRQRR